MSTQQTMSIQVQTCQVRATPSFLGEVVAKLEYGRQVQVLEDRPGWKLVLVPGVSSRGWVHESALSSKKIVLQAGTEELRHQATTGEIALAGKGFNQEVENEYRARNQNIDFSRINRMEKTGPDIAGIRDFARQGQLKL